MSLDPFYLAHVADSLDDLWNDFENDILIDLARRIKHSDGSLSSTARFRYTKLRELSASDKYIQSQIAKYLKQTDKEINRIFNDAITSSLANDDEILRQAYEKGIIAKSGYDIHDYSNLINKGVFDTYHEIKNFTKSFYASASNTFSNALDMAYLQVSSGVKSETEACKYAIESLAKNGIVTSTSKSGRLEHADVIVARAVRTGVNITSGKVMWGVLDDLECDLVETSSHMGARPSHALWQGQVFSRSGKHPKYKDFKLTGYGTGEGLCGWNCRHSFYPYFEGLSTVSARRYSMQENERMYELTQKQRYNERTIRKWKREQVVLDAGGVDSSLAARKVKCWKKINDDLIKSNPEVLKHDYFRESVPKINYLSSGPSSFVKSTFKQVGKLTNLDSEIKIKVLKAYEKQIVSSSIENAIVILANGDIFKVVGSGSTVDPTLVGDLTNAFITHNHPKEETEYSFSDLDASLFSTKNIDVLRGIDSLFTYQMSKIDLFIDDITKSMNEMSEYDFRHYKMIQRAKKFNFGYWRKNNVR